MNSYLALSTQKIVKEKVKIFDTVVDMVVKRDISPLVLPLLATAIAQASIIGLVMQSKYAPLGVILGIIMSHATLSIGCKQAHLTSSNTLFHCLVKHVLEVIFYLNAAYYTGSPEYGWSAAFCSCLSSMMVMNLNGNQSLLHICKQLQRYMLAVIAGSFFLTQLDSLTVDYFGSAIVKLALIMCIMLYVLVIIACLFCSYKKNHVEKNLQQTIEPITKEEPYL